ncbi:hypothetical protein TSAR_003937 [Trichomalopsis sarcophagae]|uniref:Uncharacterized protein n=1 Tax=Trichomalopsis sarcophagae TaxID=543379 RepID=A0A232FIS0_9HYME|nr:hypothetical protein TSAR_003937 [Trichomalopsis sarcophagae]
MATTAVLALRNRRKSDQQSANTFRDLRPQRAVKMKKEWRDELEQFCWDTGESFFSYAVTFYAMIYSHDRAAAVAEGSKRPEEYTRRTCCKRDTPDIKRRRREKRIRPGNVLLLQSRMRGSRGMGLVPPLLMLMTLLIRQEARLFIKLPRLCFCLFAKADTQSFSSHFPVNQFSGNVDPFVNSILQLSTYPRNTEKQ